MEVLLSVLSILLIITTAIFTWNRRHVYSKRGLKTNIGCKVAIGLIFLIVSIVWNVGIYIICAVLYFAEAVITLKTKNYTCKETK